MHAALTPYGQLGPDVVLDAVESLGWVCDGRLLALNSYENRVYQVGVEDAAPVVAKFYRPGRWSDPAILEEHGFAAELAAAELPMVAPLTINGNTLHRHLDFRFALFPLRGGHAPEPGNPDTLRHLGRVLGRIHVVGKQRAFKHRGTLDIASRGREPARFLLDSDWIPDFLRPAWNELLGQLLESVAACFERAGAVATLRIHGDCHPGNILWRDDQAHFVDLDDTLTAPAIQDLWMLLSGEREEREIQLSYVLEGYRMFADFDPRELHLIEALRTLRIVHYNAWLARRWDDPAFPAAFPWFAEPRHWEQQLMQLKEQLGEMQEPPLTLV